MTGASNSIRTLVIYSLVLPLALILGYFLAQLMMRDFPGKGFFRTVHTLPLMVAPIAVGASWRLLCIPGLGPLPYYIERWFGIQYRIGASVDQAFWTTVMLGAFLLLPYPCRRRRGQSP